MESSQNLFITVISILPFAIGLTIFAAYRINRSLRTNARDSLEHAANRLRMLRTSFRSHERLVFNVYAEEEPYHSKVENYRDILVVSDYQLRKLHSDYKTLRQEVESVDLQKINFIQTLSRWRQISKQVEALHAEQDIFDQQIDNLEVMRADIDNLAWQVALVVQDQNSKISRSLENLHEIASLGWRGKTFETVKNRMHALEETLRAQIPLIFFSPDPALVLDQTDVPDVISAHRVSYSLNQEIETNSEKSEQWLLEVRQLPVIVEAIQARLSKIHQDVLDLESAEIYPVRFDHSVNLLRQAQSLLNEVNQKISMRMIDSLFDLHHKAMVLDSSSESLSQEISVIGELHSAFALNALSEEVLKGDKILLEFEAVIERISAYSVENFERGDDVASIHEDVKQLKQQYQTIEKLLPVLNISEIEISSRLNELQSFRSSVNLIRPRIQSLQNTLVHLDQQKKKAWLDLKIILDLVEYLLEEIVPSEKSRKLSSIRLNAIQIQENLSSKVEVRLDTYLEKIRTLKVDVSKEGHYWRGQILLSVQSLLEKLENELQTISHTGMYQAPVFREIALSKDKVAEMIGGVEQEPIENLEDVLVDLKKLGPLLGKLLKLDKQLNTIVGPVLLLMNKAEKHAEYLRQFMLDLKGFIPESGYGWPPSSQRFSGEDYELLRVESEYASVMQSAQTPLELQRSLATIVDRYRGLQDRLEEIKRGIDQDHARYTQYAERYKTSWKMWEKLKARHKTSRIFQDAIDVFLGEIDSKWTNLESSYRNGRYPYAQALAQLRNICRQLDESQVDFDGESKIDINGYIEKV